MVVFIELSLCDDIPLPLRPNFLSEWCSSGADTKNPDDGLYLVVLLIVGTFC